MPKKSRKCIAEMVKDFFREIGDYCGPGTVARIKDWDCTDDCEKCKIDSANGNWRAVRNCHCSYGVDDIIAMMSESWNPYYYGNERDYDRWDKKWGMRIRCCIRTGLDLAGSPSAGVLGFDVCDLRRMYRGKIPAWINNGEWLDPDNKPADLNAGDCKVGIWL